MPNIEIFGPAPQEPFASAGKFGLSDGVSCFERGSRRGSASSEPHFPLSQSGLQFLQDRGVGMRSMTSFIRRLSSARFEALDEDCHEEDVDALWRAAVESPIEQGEDSELTVRRTS
jgi:hypothetical protein